MSVPSLDIKMEQFIENLGAGWSPETLAVQQNQVVIEQLEDIGATLKLILEKLS